MSVRDLEDGDAAFSDGRVLRRRKGCSLRADIDGS
jgi:hypothetical protein